MHIWLPIYCLSLTVIINMSPGNGLISAAFYSVLICFLLKQEVTVMTHGFLLAKMIAIIHPHKHTSLIIHRICACVGPFSVSAWAHSSCLRHLILALASASSSARCCWEKGSRLLVDSVREESSPNTTDFIVSFPCISSTMAYQQRERERGQTRESIS